jgi:hypothetical protein
MAAKDSRFNSAKTRRRKNAYVAEPFEDAFDAYGGDDSSILDYNNMPIVRQPAPQATRWQRENLPAAQLAGIVGSNEANRIVSERGRPNAYENTSVPEISLPQTQAPVQQVVQANPVAQTRQASPAVQAATRSSFAPSLAGQTISRYSANPFAKDFNPMRWIGRDPQVDLMSVF